MWISRSTRDYSLLTPHDRSPLNARLNLPQRLASKRGLLVNESRYSVWKNCRVCHCRICPPSSNFVVSLVHWNLISLFTITWRRTYLKILLNILNTDLRGRLVLTNLSFWAAFSRSNSIVWRCLIDLRSTSRWISRRNFLAIMLSWRCLSHYHTLFLVIWFTLLVYSINFKWDIKQVLDGWLEDFEEQGPSWQFGTFWEKFLCD